MKKVLFFIALSLLAVVSCNKEVPVPETSLSVGKTSISFSSEGGSQSVSISVNKAWKVSASQPWCSISPSEGKEAFTGDIVVTCTPNNEYDVRSCTVTITCAEKKAELAIEQGGKNALIVPSSALTLSCEAQSVDVEVQSNIQYDIAIPEACQSWLSVESTKALSSKTYTISVAANTSYSPREGYVEFRQKGQGLSSKVIVHQEPSTTPPDNEIWYTSPDGIVIEPQNAEGFGAAIVSNTYEDGLGVMTFDGPVTRIGEQAFGSTDIERIILPEGVSTIGEYAFLYCHKLADVVLPSGLSVIERGAFEGCDHLTSFNIPESVTSIASGSFEMCSSLKEFAGKFASEDHRLLVVEGEVVAFAPAGLSEYTVMSGVTGIGRSVFGYCKELISLTIPSGVVRIDSFAFTNCTNLSSVNLPETVRYIGDFAFYECRGLESIHIPESVESIVCPFYSCSSLREFTGKYASDDHRLLVDEDGCIFAFAPYGLSSYSIPKGILAIGPSVFENCLELNTISIPNSVRNIGFAAFRSCGLRSVTISAGVTDISDWAFAYCQSMESVEVLATNPPQGTPNMFEQTTCPIYVPEAAVEAYKSAPYWSKYADRIVGKQLSQEGENKYLTFTSEGHSAILLENIGGNAPYLEYSFDTVSWTQWDYSWLEFYKGRPLYLRGNNPNGFSFSSNKFSRFAAGGDMIEVSGSIMSLIDYANEIETIPSENCFMELFAHCDVLVSAPDLPATTLTERCYFAMFADCINLTSAPTLPAKVLTFGCYEYLFAGCNKLNYLECLATTIMDSDYHPSTFAWLEKVASTGTFVKAPGMNAWQYGSYGIPEGWTVTDSEAQSSDSDDYLTFTSDGYSGIILDNNGGNAPFLEFSFDTVSWTQWDYSMLEFRSGRPLYLRGNNPSGFSSSMSTCSIFASAGDPIHITGSIMALIDYSKEVTSIPCDYCFFGLFYHCDRLLTAPSLPAMNLTVGCYIDMFANCSSLTTAPTLPAKYLVEECYERMFYGCTNLNYVKCLATDISAGGCTYWWLEGVAPNGTFVKAAEMSGWPSGISGIPEGWGVTYAE